jgi:hypothetical protein
LDNDDAVRDQSGASTERTLAYSTSGAGLDPDSLDQTLRPLDLTVSFVQAIPIEGTTVVLVISLRLKL